MRCALYNALASPQPMRAAGDYPQMWGTRPQCEEREERFMSKADQSEHLVKRRDFVKIAAATTGAAAIAGASPKLKALAVDFSSKPEAQDEQVFSTICRSNCFQGCLLKAHVRDGMVCKMSPAPYPEKDYTGCCLRGLLIHERAYSNTRVKYPMVREGERGEDKWKRVTWDEALDELSVKFTEIRAKYGNNAIAMCAASGNQGTIHAAKGVSTRFSNALEMTRIGGCYDMQYGYGTSRVVGGGSYGNASEIAGVKDAKTVMIWGANPVNSSPQNWRFIQQAHEKGTRLVNIDPMYSGTVAKCDEWIPIKAGTDLFLALALVNYVLQNELYDEAFTLKNTTAPFLLNEATGKIMRSEEAQAALAAGGSKIPGLVWDTEAGALGESDKVAKPALEGTFDVDGVPCVTIFTALKKAFAKYTLADAAQKTGIPADKIKEIADIYVNQGPVFLYTVFAIDHFQNSHLFGQAIAILHAITGNVGVPGTSLSGFWFWAGTFNAGGITGGTGKASFGGIPMVAVAETIKSGKNKGKDHPIKALLVACSNPASNYAQQNLWFDTILPGLDFVVTLETELNDTARYSDMVLPVCTWLEVDDVRVNFCNPFVALNEKAIDPLYEAKPDAEVFCLIAQKLGLGDIMPNKDAKEWIEVFMTQPTLNANGINYDRLKKEKAIRAIASPEHPFVFGEGGFATTSGRAELYCETVTPRVNYGQDFSAAAEAEHFPYAKAPNEADYDSELAKKYPFILTTGHSRWRTHTQWFASEHLRELEPEPLLSINPDDAAARGISTGDVVTVFNDRGSFALRAVVTAAVTPGYLNMPKGWQRNQFISGSYQEVTNVSTDPMGVNFTFFDTLVEVKKGE